MRSVFEPGDGFIFLTVKGWLGSGKPSGFLKMFVEPFAKSGRVAPPQSREAFPHLADS